ncbi:P-loop NTPase fold protein [Alkalimonas sp. MEB108]|uniref:P-loop NTPase fold protein n=1 Tax=Alkalimonas cellulosilytica TaxID=3058395 RepID=A0ABU7J1K4_9GAMM|nr:P-loop NTPase fold protein [Alkalimonas sp. MEB108]MEE2000366.1 P-loop NTPase fold protein [Alkalimonas sp. MEB108]
MQTINCKHKEWLSQYTFDNCKLDRGDYGKFLKNYLMGERDGFVLNLNGAWGTGKTEFLRRLYSLFISEDHPVIYIDAWESDFSEMPLSVVSSELLSQLSTVNDHIGAELTKVGEFLGKAVKGAIIGGAGLLSKHLLADTTIGNEMAKALFEKKPNDFLDDIKHEHVEQIEAIKCIRRELGNLAEVINKNYGLSLPVIVLVDELDRCRPSYAIEMLEVIKHFFTTKNFVFVVATDTQQLRQSIKSVYGSEFDSTTYLRRFFNREARMDEPKLESYVKLSMLSIDNYDDKVVLYPDVKNSVLESVHEYLAWLGKAYTLSLRDLDQLINKFNACLRSALSSYESSQRVQVINIFSLIVAIIEFDKDFERFNQRKNYTPIIEGNFNDFTVGSGGNATKLSKFYELSMLCSVKHKVRQQGNFGRDVELDVLGNYKINFIGSQSKFNGLSGKALVNIGNLFNEYSDNGSARVWLWEDYQKIVKLAGLIK